MSDKGHQNLINGVKALSLTGLEDLLRDNKLSSEIEQEFNKNR